MTTTTSQLRSLMDCGAFALVLCLVLPERPFLTNAAPQQTAEVDRLAELEEANWLDERAGRRVIWSGEFAEAVPLAERVLTIREKALGSDHPLVAVSLDHLA